MTSLALALALALAAAGPLAEDPDYVAGKELYNDFAFEEAVFRFQKAALSSQDRSPADQAEVFLWLGLAYANSGDFHSAERQFKDALTLAPDITVPTKTSPKIADLLEEVRADVKANPPPPPQEDPPIADDPPAVEEPPPDDTLPLILWGSAAGLGGVSLASIGGAGVLAFLITQDLEIARDPNSFQDDAKAALDRANASAVGATVLVAVGVLAASGAVALGVFAAVE